MYMMTHTTSYSIQSLDKLHESSSCSGGLAELVRLDRGRPHGLLNGGCHFLDAPRNRFPSTDFCPMDMMMQQVKEMNLLRPKN